MNIICAVFGHLAEYDRRSLRMHCRRCDGFSRGFQHELGAKVRETTPRVIFAEPDGRQKLPSFYRVWSRRRTG